MATTIHSPQFGSRFGGRTVVVGLAALAASIAIGAAGLAVRDRTSPTAPPAAVAAPYLVKADRWYLETVGVPTVPMPVKADRWYER